jgi:hypothetical protein
MLFAAEVPLKPGNPREPLYWGHCQAVALFVLIGPSTWLIHLNCAEEDIVAIRFIDPSDPIIE